jgi:hypothetical protein
MDRRANGEIAPNIYCNYITLEPNNQLVLYMKLQKALYGFLRSALLCYKKCFEDLESKDFELNPYDPCVANIIIQRK